DPEFPSPAQFDHVITRAVAGGQVVWLDVTAEVAPFRLLAPALRARQALVTDVDPAPRLEETPADPPMRGLADTTIDGRVDAAGTLSAAVTRAVRGDQEVPRRTAVRAVPAAQWPDLVDQIVKRSGLDAKVSALKVSDPQATREPFTVGFRIEAAGFVDLAKKKIDVELPLAQEGANLDLPDGDPIVMGG